MSGRAVLQLEAVALVLALGPLALCPMATEPTGATTTTNATQPNPWSPNSPYVDSVIFRVIPGDDLQAAALLSGEIDCNPESLPLDAVIWPLQYPVQILETQAFGFDCFAVNCQRYPFSIPAFRRALALAIYKPEIAAILWGSLGYPLDSPLSPSCGAWYNNNTSPRYGQADLYAAKAELAAAGFVDIDGDGYVEAPDGTDFTFRVLYDSAGGSSWVSALNASQAYWNLASISVLPDPATTTEIVDTLFTVPRDYDGALFHFEAADPGPSPLSLKTWTSSQIFNPDGNFLNWANATYDENINRMMTSADHDAVLEAALEAQQVFVCEVPMIVLCVGCTLNAYRIDKFGDWVVSPGVGIGYENLWVPRKVRLLSNQPERDAANGCGGTLRTIIKQDIDTSNPLLSTSVHDNYVLGQVYDSLTGLADPRTHLPIKTGGGLAYDWTTSVLADALHFDFTLYDNATWHDGIPVTAEDVAFSYNYIKNFSAPEYAEALGYLYSCIAVDHTHVRIIANSTSYWAFDQLRDWPILPKHIWEGIISPLTFQNPNPVGSGPFRWYRRVEGEYIELRFWESYHKMIPGHGDWTWHPPPPPPIIPLAALVLLITVVSSVAYLSKRKQSATKAGARVPSELRHHETPPRSGVPHFCSFCGGELFSDEAYCPRCGNEAS